MFSEKLKAQYAGLAERQAAKKARLAQSADATTPDAPKKPYSFSDASPEQAATSTRALGQAARELYQCIIQ